MLSRKIFISMGSSTDHMTDSTPFPEEDELPDEEPDLSEIDPFEEDPAEFEDINEFVEQDWSESKTARQRVKNIIVRATSPRSVAEIAELADVSEPTARSELNELAEEGTVLAESTENGCVYQRDPDWYRIKRVRGLAEKSQSALETTLHQLEQEIETYKEEYGVDSPEELILSDGPLGDKAWEDISHWRTALVDREYLRTALQYAKLQRSEELLLGDERSENKEPTSA
jgi:predicted transcriptional regulator